MEENTEKVVEETTQEETQQEQVEEQKPEVDLSKFESADDPEVTKIDLTQPPPTQEDEQPVDNAETEDTSPFLPGEEVPHVFHEGAPPGGLGDSLDAEEDAQENNQGGGAHGDRAQHRQDQPGKNHTARPDPVSTDAPDELARRVGDQVEQVDRGKLAIGETHPVRTGEFDLRYRERFSRQVKPGISQPGDPEDLPSPPRQAQRGRVPMVTGSSTFFPSRVMVTTIFCPGRVAKKRRE